MKRSRPFPAASLCVVLALLLLVLGGCGGGGGRHGSGSSGGNGGGTMDPVQRAAAIKATEEACRTLTQQNLSPDAFDEALRQAMAANPAYKTVGVNAESHTVYGTFPDGRVHMVANDFTPKRNGRGPSLATGRAVSLPDSKQARLLHSFGANFDGQDPINDVTGWLKGAGYNVVAGAEGDASLDVLRNVKNDGFFYLNTHGGGHPLPSTGAKAFAVQSSTVSSSARDVEPAIKDDLDHDRLVYFTARNGDTFLHFFDDWDTRYAVTASFVDKYWSFAPNSIVFINACYSAYTDTADGAQGFISTCQKKGAGVYLGWTRKLGSPTAYRAIRYFADRVLGANAFEPETPRQRPFDWELTLADMHTKGIDRDAETGAQLVAFATAGVKPPILGPTTERMLVDERRDRLVLLGGFGDKAGTATIDGAPVNVAAWTNERVELELPRDGKGACGPVQLAVDGRKGNVRNLTEWRFTVPYEHTLPGIVGPVLKGPVNLRFRGDVGEYRLKPGEPTTTHPLWAIATRDSSAKLAASGTYSQGDTSITWSGAHTFAQKEYANLDHFLVARLAINPATRKGTLALSIGAEPGKGLFTSTARGPGGSWTSAFAALFGPMEGTVKYEDPVENSGIPGVPFPSLNLVFASDWSLQPHGYLDQLQVKLTVPTTAAEFPPVPETGH